MERQVVLFTTEAGVTPFEVYIRGIPNKASVSQVMAAVMKMTKGLFGDYKSVGDGVQEYRLHGLGHRIYFYFDGPVMVVLLGGSDKSKQVREIAKAKENLLEYKTQKTKNAEAMAKKQKGRIQ